MKLEHEFTVPAPVDEAWKVLLDVERVAPCMPGATLLTVEGNEFTGTVKVKVGPIQVTYKGNARFAELDEATHRAVIEASGKEARGSGTAAATVRAVLLDAGGSTTKVAVETELDVTGRPAQFGRGVMAEVAAKLIGQFASCLADELGSPATPQEPKPAEAAPATPVASPPVTPEPVAPKPAPPKAPAAKTPAASAPAAEAPAAPAPAEPVQPVTRPPLPPTSAGPVEAAPAPAAAPSAGPRQVAPPARPAEPIDLLEVAGASVAKRVVPVAALVALLLFLLWRRRHRS